MRKYLGWGYVVLACLPALVGCCCKKRVQVVKVTPDYYIVNSAKKGDTLEWRAFVSGQDEFVIHFIGQSPCKGDDGKPVSFKLSKNGVVSCKLDNDGQFDYTYFFDGNNQEEKKDAAGPRQCGGCRTQQSPNSGADKSLKVTPQATTGGASNDTTGAAVTDGTDGNVIITCGYPTTKIPGVSGPNAPGQTIYWEPNGPTATTDGWSVTFPTTGAPLCKGGVTTFNSGNPLCKLAAPIPAGTYQSVTTGQCSTSTSYPVPALAPPNPGPK